MTLLHIRQCPNWAATHRLLAELSSELDINVSCKLVTSLEEAERLGFRGSPAVLVDGTDVFAEPSDPVGLACRVYETPEGLSGAPTIEMLRSALTGRRQVRGPTA
ncbi:hypothetical protein BH23ACT5_BH23ACT5_22350 [soil metagenome]